MDSEVRIIEDEDGYDVTSVNLYHKLADEKSQKGDYGRKMYQLGIQEERTRMCEILDKQRPPNCGEKMICLHWHGNDDAINRFLDDLKAELTKEV